MALRKPIRAFVLAVAFVFFPAGASSQTSASGTVPLIIDGNRVYAQLAIRRPNGTWRDVVFFVDPGSASMIVSPALLLELNLGPQIPLMFRLGEMTVAVNSCLLTGDPWLPFTVAGNRKVEGLLPAGVLQKFTVVIDYGHHLLTLAQPGTLEPGGTSVPIEVNETTGLAVVEAKIDRKTYPITIDNGSAYTWLGKSAANEWLGTHPEWHRGIGAVGVSNMRMEDDGVEAAGLLLRIPEVRLGSLTIPDMGALAIGPNQANWDLLDWYSQKNPIPVIGWLGGNVLRNFRITIDYPKRMSYWVRQSAPDEHELDQVGLTLSARGGELFVAGVATQNGKATVAGVQVGDKLVRIDDLPAKNANWGAIFAAMHGKPGEIRTLRLERNGKSFTVNARVTSFLVSL